MTQQVETKKSKLVEWLENRPRWFKDVDICGAGLRNHDGSPVAKVRFQINTKADDNDAILCAYRDAEQLAKKFTKESVDEARRDPDFLQDLKSVHALWRACRDPETGGPAFITPEWIIGKPGEPMGLDAHQISYLMNIYNACKREAAGIDHTYERARVDAYRDAVVASWSSEFPERSLAPLPREHLEMLTLQAMRFWDEDRAALLARIDELERATALPATLDTTENDHASHGEERGGGPGEAS